MEIKFYGAFVLNLRVDLHAIDATPTHWLISTQTAAARSTVRNIIICLAYAPFVKFGLV